MSRAAELTLQNLQLPTALRERRCKLALGSHHLNGSRHQSPLQFPIVHFLYTIRILSLMQKYTCYLIFDYCSDLYRFFCITFMQKYTCYLIFDYCSDLYRFFCITFIPTPVLLYALQSQYTYIFRSNFYVICIIFCFKRLVGVTCIWYTQVADILHFFGIADLLLEGVDQIS